MKAEELRIGNYIQWSGNVHSIESIQKDWATIRKKNSQEFRLPYHKINPILLTEEWLLKLGFKEAVENAGNLPCFKKGNITIAKWIGGKWQSWYKTIDFPVSPQTVHKLQNLYFALTGEELVIKDGL